jgi:hypothetical protein
MSHFSDRMSASLIHQNDRFTAAMLGAPEARRQVAFYRFHVLGETGQGAPKPDIRLAGRPGFRFQAIPCLDGPARVSMSSPVDGIILAVCHALGLTRPELLSKHRHAHLFEARCVAAFLLRARTGLKPGRIGMVLGGRDRTTILHGLNRVREEAERFAPLIRRAEALL